MELLHPAAWKDYELLDSGDFEKLERFGPFNLIRPEPQAIWSKTLPAEEWRKLASARFVREQKDHFRMAHEGKGGWSNPGKVPEHWTIQYPCGPARLTFRLALTSFGHVGLFPEQGANWDFIDETLRGWGAERARVLNLFAYTGAASVVARAAGADVTHVDASRPGLNWARENMELNGLKDIRWIYEDALKYVKREVKRGSRYHGIIMDPPPYGRGPQGEKWDLTELLNELVSLTRQLLEPRPRFFILNTYAIGLSALAGRNVVKAHFPDATPEFGEFFLKARTGPDLPMGAFVRFRSGPR